MMVKTNNNDPVRPTLASQLDRLDRILDGLSEALNEAVANAVQGAVGVAVKEALQTVLVERLTHPALSEQMPPPVPPAPAPLHDLSPPVRRSWLTALLARLRWAATWVYRLSRRQLAAVVRAGAGVAATAAALLFLPKLALLVRGVASNVTARTARLGLG